MSGNAHAVSIRYEPVKTEAALKGEQEHDSFARPSYVDRSRSHLNTFYGSRKFTLKKLWAETNTARCALRDAGDKSYKALKPDALLLMRGIVTFGIEAQKIIHAMSAEEQDATIRKIIEDQHTVLAGREVLYWAVHRDESAVHAHFMMRAYDPNHRPWRYKRSDMARVQDAAAASVAHLGIERGYTITYRLGQGDTRAETIHRSVRQLHADLPQEIEAKRIEIQTLETEILTQQQKSQKNRRLISEQEVKLNQGKATEEKAAARIATYQKRQQEAEESEQIARQKLQQVQQTVENLTEQSAQLAQKVHESEQKAAQADILANQYHEQAEQSKTLLAQTERDIDRALNDIKDDLQPLKSVTVNHIPTDKIPTGMGRLFKPIETKKLSLYHPKQVTEHIQQIEKKAARRITQAEYQIQHQSETIKKLESDVRSLKEQNRKLFEFAQDILTQSITAVSQVIKPVIDTPLIQLILSRIQTGKELIDSMKSWLKEEEQRQVDSQIMADKLEAENSKSDDDQDQGEDEIDNNQPTKRGPNPWD